MKIRLYQIVFDAKRHTMFLDYARTLALGGVDTREYAKVFDGDIRANDLEDVYRTFNIRTTLPHGYRGRSMSISDVVVTEEGAFFTDRVGFVKIPFEEHGIPSFA